MAAERGKDILGQLARRKTPGERLVARLDRRYLERPRVCISARIFRLYRLNDPWDPLAKVEEYGVGLGPVSLRLGQDKREPAPHAQPKEQPSAKGPAKAPPPKANDGGLPPWARNLPDVPKARTPAAKTRPPPAPPAPPLAQSELSREFGAVGGHGLKGPLPIRPELAAKLALQAAEAAAAGGAADTEGPKGAPPIRAVPPRPASAPRPDASKAPAPAAASAPAYVASTAKVRKFSGEFGSPDGPAARPAPAAAARPARPAAAAASAPTAPTEPGPAAPLDRRPPMPIRTNTPPSKRFALKSTDIRSQEPVEVPMAAAAAAADGDGPTVIETRASPAAPPPDKPVERRLPRMSEGLDDIFGMAMEGGRMSVGRARKTTGSVGGTVDGGDTPPKAAKNDGAKKAD